MPAETREAMVMLLTVLALPECPDRGKDLHRDGAR
jgi:hypothetical protein